MTLIQAIKTRQVYFALFRGTLASIGLVVLAVLALWVVGFLAHLLTRAFVMGWRLG